MGEQYQFEGPGFNRSIRIEARGERQSSDSGALAVREVLEKLKLSEWLKRRLDDPRQADLVTHPTLELLNTYLLLQAQGWHDEDDADRLRDDPVLRLAVSTRRGQAPLRPVAAGSQTPDGLASQPTLSRMLAWLSTETNRAVLSNSLMVTAGRRIRSENHGHRLRYETLDVDSLPIEVFGDQPASQFNGHYGATVYHPLVATLGTQRDVVGVMLRAGAVHTAEDALPFILERVEWIKREVAQRVTVRMDAGFPSEHLLKGLEDAQLEYVARIRSNAVLDRMAAPLVALHGAEPTPGRDGLWCYEFTYKAGTWSRKRRVVLVIQERPGELFPEHFWLLTNISEYRKPGLELLALYRERGNAEAAMGEWKSVLAPSLSSSPRPKSSYRGKPVAHRTPLADAEGLDAEDLELEPFRRSFQINETILILNALAYNLLNVLRKQAEIGTGEGWSIKRTREQLLKVGAQVLLHARRVTVTIPKSVAGLWDTLWYRISKLSYQPTTYATS